MSHCPIAAPKQRLQRVAAEADSNSEGDEGHEQILHEPRLASAGR